MKKVYYSISLILLMSVMIFFSGCQGNSNEGYIEIQSIEYRLYESNNVFESYIAYELNEPSLEVTEEEFRTGEGHRYSLEEHIQSFNTTINEDRSNLNYLKVNDTFYYSYSYGEYFKTTIKKVYPCYVKVKIDNDILYIIKGTGSKICIKPESFTIQYFK